MSRSRYKRIRTPVHEVIKQVTLTCADGQVMKFDCTASRDKPAHQKKDRRPITFVSKGSVTHSWPMPEPELPVYNPPPEPFNFGDDSDFTPEVRQISGTIIGYMSKGEARGTIPKRS